MRSRAMMGFDAPYVPGWDCHGLPIEQQVDKKLGSKKRDMSAVEIRRACREYAQEFIGIQREEFQRLGVGGDWNRPYTDDGVPVRGRDRARLRRLLRQGARLPGAEVGALVLHGPDRARRSRARVRGARRTPRSTSRFPAEQSARPGSHRCRRASSSGRRRPGRSPPTSRSPCIPTRRTPSSRRTGGTSSWPRSSRRRVAKAAGWIELEDGGDAAGQRSSRGCGIAIPSPAAIARRADARGGRRARSASCSATTSRWTPAPASSTRPRATARTTS